MAHRVFWHQNLLWRDACRSKCVFHDLRCALARRSSIQMLYRCAQMCSRSTPVCPNAFPMCSHALSLDARRSRCVSHVLRCALARRPSIQMRFPRAQMHASTTRALNKLSLTLLLQIELDQTSLGTTATARLQSGDSNLLSGVPIGTPLSK